jgi:myo-inositol-1(or 4)-monophosphatase
MSTADDPSGLRALAERIAVEAGTLALEGRSSLGPGKIRHDTKSTATDPVTEYDRAAERLLVDRLRAECPEDAIVGEEGTGIDGTSGRSWYLDPIDGTANFVYGLPGWCTSVGVLDAGGGLAGAVYAPVSGELFSAARGLGATLDGAPISTSGCTDLADAMIATGFAYRPALRRVQAIRLAGLIDHVRDVRRGGSAAIDLCLVACGRVDAYYEQHLNTWDVAAGLLIAAEAGATTLDDRGDATTPSFTVASAPGIHTALLDVLDASFPDDRSH